MKKYVLIGRLSSTPTVLSDLQEYILTKKDTALSTLYHPLRGTSIVHSYYYNNNILYKKIRQLDNEFIQYFTEFIRTSLFLLGHNGNINVFIGMNNFDLLPGILLRLLKVKKINKIIFYSIDYSSERFTWSLLNKILWIFDCLCVKYSNLVISNSYRTRCVRDKQGCESSKNIIIPNGVNLEAIHKTIKPKAGNTLFYIGYFDVNHGILNCMRELINCAKKYSWLKIKLIGLGPDYDNINQLILKYKVNSRILLYNNLERKEIFTILSKGGVGIAPYILHDDWVYYCDPIKIKEYLAFGCPVVTTDVIEISKTLEQKKCGIISGDSKDTIDKAIEILSNRKLHLKMSINAIRFSKKYNNVAMFKKINI